jgi:hypothetical protein
LPASAIKESCLFAIEMNKLTLAEKSIKVASVITNEEYLTNIVAFHCKQAIPK